MTSRDELLDEACDSLLTYLRRSVPRQSEVVSKMGMTLHQFRALIMVYNEDGCTTTDLADAVRVHPSVATGIVQRMVSRGIFRRVEDADDRRIRRLYLTEEGRAIADEVVGTARQQRRDQLAALDDDELASLARLLQRVTTSIEGARVDA